MIQIDEMRLEVNRLQSEVRSLKDQNLQISDETNQYRNKVYNLEQQNNELLTKLKERDNILRFQIYHIYKSQIE